MKTIKTGRGGKREGSGRKQGAATTRTRDIANQIAASGSSPLEYLLSVMRDVAAEPQMRMDAAKSAAPYVHPRLAAIEHSGDAKKPVVLTFGWMTA